MTETEALTAINAAVDGYFAMWNETNPVRRRELIQETWAPDAHYVNPVAAADGPDGLDALVAGFHTQYANHRFQRTTTITVHHDRARWDWELIGPDGGAPVDTGTDFAVFMPDGRLREVTGFFEPHSGAA